MKFASISARKLLRAAMLVTVALASLTVTAWTPARGRTGLMTASGYVDHALNVPPPPGFNPLIASDAQLRRYGFPHRPKDPKALAQWKQAMQHARQYLPPKPMPVAKWFSTTGTAYSGSWAGYYVPNSGNSSGNVTETTSQWNVPAVSSIGGSQPPDAAFWTGTGGTSSSSSGIVQAGTDSVTSNPAHYTFWTEDYPQNSVQQNNPPVNPGDNAYVDVTYNSNQTATYYLEDVTTGQYTSITYSAPNYDGSSADYINEWTPWGLAHYGTVNFGDCLLYWAGSGSGEGDLGAYNNTQVVMTSNGLPPPLGSVLVQPSPIGSNLVSFSVSY